MRISRKYICTRTNKVLWGGKSIETTQTKKPQRPTKNDDPQIPQPDLRFASGNSEANGRKQTKTPQNGARAQTKTPTESICHGTQWLVHCIPIKNMPNELGITAFQADMKALACEFTLAWAKLYTKAGLQLKPLSESSQISSSMGLHGHSSRHHICQPRPRSRDVETIRSPPRGGWTVMANGKHRRPGKSFQTYHRQKRHAPSFIGEDAAILLIGLSLRIS